MRTRPTEIYLYEWSVLAWTNSRTRLELDATGRGLFRELLDRCFTQGSIPKDPALICQIGGCTRDQFEVIWPLISRHFQQDKKDPSSLRNKRADAFRSDFFRYCKEQKQRRNEAIQRKKGTDTPKRESKEPAKSNPGNGLHDHGSTVVDSRNDLIRDDTRRYETIRDDTNSETNSAPLDVRVPARPVVQAIRDARNASAQPANRFEELWERWPRQTGKPQAERDYFAFVTPENEAPAFECLERYLASGEVARGVVRNLGSIASGGTLKPGWLADCAKENWACDWPRARDPTIDKRRQPAETEPLEGLYLDNL